MESTRQYWFIEKLAKLKIDDERISTLSEIRREFSSLSQNEAKMIADKLDLPAVFDCLNDTNQEQIDLACDVLTMCMGQLSLGESTKRYTISLQRAIKHPSPHVKLMVLKEIERTVSSGNEELLLQISRSTSLLTNLIKCIADLDLDVVTRATNVIINMCLTEGIVQQMMSPDIISKFEDIIVESEVIKLRIFELMIKGAVQSPKMLSILASSGLMNHLLTDLDSNDILFRLNIIELLSNLVAVDHGYEYLKNENVIAKLEKQVNEIDSNVEYSFCEPGLLKFFGHLGHLHPNEAINQHRIFSSRLFSLINGELNNHYVVVLDVLGHIAETNSGKIVLEAFDDIMPKTLKCIMENIPYMEMQLKPRALACVECCFHMDTQDLRVSEFLRKWYDFFSNGNLEIVLKYAQNPTIEIRLAGLKLLLSLCEHNWAQDYIKITAGTIEFLLNRNSERTKDCKELKYGIVKLLSNSCQLDSGSISKMQQFVKEGPFYMEPITEIAIEGNE